MQAIRDFKLVDVPQHKILLAVTSEPDYQMQRILIAEDYPDYETAYVVIQGWHCSCYGFDETRWDAMTYTEAELKKVLQGWLTSGTGMEKAIAHLWLMSGRNL